MRPLTPQPQARIEWEERVLAIMGEAGLTRSDAQGITEVDRIADLLDRAYATGYAPEVGALAALQASEVR